VRLKGMMREGEGESEKERERERVTSPCTYKALASVYITYVVQFHDVSLQFRRRIFHHYPTVFLPRVLAIQRSSYPLPLSPSPSSEFSLFLSSFTPASGTAHHFVNQDKLEISSREIQPRCRGFDLAGYIGRQRYPAVPTRY